jgi:GDPmannose 4,6-dehydratase
VTRKITHGLANFLKTGEPIELGNLEAKRDWGHAQDYVEAMWLMLQQPEPEDFVIGTGQTYSIREFVLAACAHMTQGQTGVMFSWEGSGVDEKLVMTNGTERRDVIHVNPEFYRPAEVDILIADASKAKTKLGWVPKISFQELVKRMMNNDINGAQ